MDTLGLSFSIKSLDDAGLIEGLAAGFGNVDHGGDVIMPGAFAKSLASRGGRAVPMLHNHDQGRPIGVWTNLRETGEGLAAKGRIAGGTDDRSADDAAYLVAQGIATIVGPAPVQKQARASPNPSIARQSDGR